MGPRWFTACCAKTDISKRKASRSGSTSNNSPVRIQPGPVGGMRVYEELDESYGPKVERDYREIQKAMETAPREVVQQALGMEPQTSETAESKQKSISMQQSDGLDRCPRQVRFEEGAPVDNHDSGFGDVHTAPNSDSNGGDHDGSDSAIGVAYSRCGHDSHEDSDVESVAEIATAVRMSVKPVAADIAAARLDSLETPEDEELFVISGEKEGDSDSGSVSCSASEYSVDDVLVSSHPDNEAMAQSPECRGLSEEIPGVARMTIGPEKKQPTAKGDAFDPDMVLARHV